MPSSPLPTGRLGVLIDRSLPPEQLVPLVRLCEGAPAVDDVWVVEDLGWAGAISTAATALAATERLHVGIGIVPAPLRNPALLAMELATLGRLHPGRLTSGIGHGVQSWMRGVNAAVASPLTLLEETFTVVRALLRGDRVTYQGRFVRVDDLALVHPPGVADAAAGRRDRPEIAAPRRPDCGRHQFSPRAPGRPRSPPRGP